MNTSLKKDTQIKVTFLPVSEEFVTVDEYTTANTKSSKPNYVSFEYEDTITGFVYADYKKKNAFLLKAYVENVRKFYYYLISKNEIKIEEIVE